MWHASIARHGRDHRPLPLARIRNGDTEHTARALGALRGVGDATAGEWLEIGDVAVHLRRRLTTTEWRGQPWGMDLRHTEEGRARLIAAGCRREWSDEW